MVFVYLCRYNELFCSKTSFYQTGSEVKNHHGTGRNLGWVQVWTKQLLRWLENFNNIFNIVSGLLSFQDQEGNDSHHIFAFVVSFSGSELGGALLSSLFQPPLMAFSKEKNRGGQSSTQQDRRGDIAKYRAERERERERELDSAVYWLLVGW